MGGLVLSVAELLVNLHTKIPRSCLLDTAVMVTIHLTLEKIEKPQPLSNTVFLKDYAVKATIGEGWEPRWRINSHPLSLVNALL